MSKKIILSGIQPTGDLHIGNYLGAIKNWVDLQNSGEYECHFFLADYHSISGDRSAQERREQITKTAIELIAAGIDPEKSTLFVQSHVQEHTELGWIFNTVTPMTELERMTQYKDKSQDQAKNINVGLFTYPVLQAADILLYQATHVPVGEDQLQHVELTRDIARWFNNKYGETFVETEAILTDTPRIKSLLKPEKKMSKSLGEGNAIALADEPEVIEKKIKKAVTATEGGSDSAGVDNLLLLLKHFGSQVDHESFTLAQKDGSIRYGDLKSAVSESIAFSFANFREKRKEMMMNHDAIAEILSKGAEVAQEKAKGTMEVVRERIGVR